MEFRVQKLLPNVKAVWLSQISVFGNPIWSLSFESGEQS